MAVHTPHRIVTGPAVVATADTGPSPWVAVGWLAGGAVLTFAVSWLGTTLPGLQHDLYYLIYFIFALGYLAAFVRRSGVALREVLRRNLWRSLAVGVLLGAAVVSQVAGQDGTGHPGGTLLRLRVAWRGVVYGSVDALILCVFPALLAWLMLHGNRTGAKRKFAFAGLVLMFSLLISAAYHLGYTTYRGMDLAKPEIGAVMWAVPAMLTGNPAGSVVAHTAVHTTAVVHQYYGGENHFLPPELTSSYTRPG